VACMAARSTASLPGMPLCPGAQINTTERREGVRTRFKRINIRWTRGCVKKTSWMAVREARESEMMSTLWEEVCERFIMSDRHWRTAWSTAVWMVAEFLWRNSWI